MSSFENMSGSDSRGAYSPVEKPASQKVLGLFNLSTSEWQATKTTRVLATALALTHIALSSIQAADGMWPSVHSSRHSHFDIRRAMLPLIMFGFCALASAFVVPTLFFLSHNTFYVRERSPLAFTACGLPILGWVGYGKDHLRYMLNPADFVSRWSGMLCVALSLSIAYFMVYTKYFTYAPILIAPHGALLLFIAVRASEDLFSYNDNRTIAFLSYTAAHIRHDSPYVNGEQQVSVDKPRRVPYVSSMRMLISNKPKEMGIDFPIFSYVVYTFIKLQQWSLEVLAANYNFIFIIAADYAIRQQTKEDHRLVNWLLYATMNFMSSAVAAWKGLYFYLTTMLISSIAYHEYAFQQRISALMDPTWGLMLAVSSLLFLRMLWDFYKSWISGKFTFLPVSSSSETDA